MRVKHSRTQVLNLLEDVIERDVQRAFRKGAHDMRARIVARLKDEGLETEAAVAQSTDVLDMSPSADWWKDRTRAG
jgi:hypothetical protein